MSDIIRRDPRAEWIARNRLHPLHAAMQPVQHSWMGPNGVIRKNVHGVGFIGPNGIKRIDRSGAQQGGATKRTAAVASAVAAASGAGAGVLHQRGAGHGRRPPEQPRPRPARPGPATGRQRRCGAGGGVWRTQGKRVRHGRRRPPAGARTAMHSTVIHRSNACRACGLWITSSTRAIWLLPDSRSGGGELGRRLPRASRSARPRGCGRSRASECIGRAGAGQARPGAAAAAPDPGRCRMCRSGQRHPS